MKRYILAGAALSVVLAAALSTAALAQRNGQHGSHGQMPGFGPMGGFDFDAADADADGTITEDEFNAFRQSQVTAADTNSDGMLSADELRAAYLARAEKRASDAAARMIEMRDSDGDGLLSAAEMATPAMRKGAFARLDGDGDGAISAAEAQAAQARMAERRKHHGAAAGKE